MTDEQVLGNGSTEPVTEPEPAELAAAAAAAERAEPAEPAADADLLALIDRLAGLLERSDLTELEVESVGRASCCVRWSPSRRRGCRSAAPVVEVAAQAAVSAPESPPARPAVSAPLTGIFYASPASVRRRTCRSAGRLPSARSSACIEAMKLFNEIKSDLAGRVVKVVAESGAPVKAKQPLIEVEPL